MDTTATPPRDQTVQELRALSRQLVRELGFMRTTLADSGLAPSAVHAVLEVGAAPGIQARDLAGILRLDKSNTSRQLAKLEAQGLLERRRTDGDARSAALQLTAAGQALRQKIDRFATDQVSDALQRLVPTEQQALLRSLALYAGALAPSSGPTEPRGGTAIVEGYMPGCIGDVAALHARFYAQHAGFGVYFEQKVATELAAFAGSLPDARKGLWLCVAGGRTLASLAIDADTADDGSRLAHLRWFIVDDSLRGTGMGRELLARAMRFADAHFDATYLWTFRGLDAARHLYESVGFALTDEAEGDQWGARVTEQRFLRHRPAA
ncbi:MAG: bifunctional helix-turn-helix transcriptional regulator/GNAT family N-acetyltransferase [Comamonas sp.]